MIPERHDERRPPDDELELGAGGRRVWVDGVEVSPPRRSEAELDALEAGAVELEASDRLGLAGELEVLDELRPAGERLGREALAGIQAEALRARRLAARDLEAPA